MFLKPENFDMENGIQKIKKYPLKNSYTAETGNWKRHFSKGSRITRPKSIEWIALQFL